MADCALSSEDLSRIGNSYILFGTNHFASNGSQRMKPFYSCITAMVRLGWMHFQWIRVAELDISPSSGFDFFSAEVRRGGLGRGKVLAGYLIKLGFDEAFEIMVRKA